MTQRARRRRRRLRDSGRRKILLAVGLPLAVIGIGAVGRRCLAAERLRLGALAREPEADHEGGRLEGVRGRRLADRGDPLRQDPAADRQRQIPQDLKDATVAIEDRRFYSHGGIDPSAIIRAGWEDLTAGGKPVEGGSTITQQLVRNLYIEDPQDTLKRKIIEAHLANDEEDQHSKDWILTEYLNTAPYGTNEGATAIGVEAAAETYYSKHAADLTLPEAAMIAGLPQAPSQYNPLLNPRAALARRNEVLQAMEQQGKISASEYAGCPRPGPGPRPGTQVQPDPRALHLRPRQAGAPGPLRSEHRPERRAQGLYDDPAAAPGGGAKRRRLLLGLLLGRRPGVGTGLGRSLERRDRRPGLDPALLVTSQFNFAAHAQRQPGSSFKVYDLTAAIKQGIDPDTTYYDGTSPKTLETPGGSPWTVNNAEPGGGVMALTQATWDSVNVVFAQLGLDVGPENIAKTAYEMGITSPLGIKGAGDIPCKLGPNCYIPPADAIGGLSVGVTPLEQADAYATLANGGVHHDATAIDRGGLPRRKGGRAERKRGQARADSRARPTRSRRCSRA